METLNDVVWTAEENVELMRAIGRDMLPVCMIISCDISDPIIDMFARCTPPLDAYGCAIP